MSAKLKRSYAFTVVPNDFIKASLLSHEAFRIYVVLCMHAPGGADDNATVFPDYERIKLLTGVRHNQTIATRMRELEGAGWLQRAKRFGQSTVYTLTIPSPGEPQSVTPRINAPDDALHGPSHGVVRRQVNDIPSPGEPQSVTPSKTNKNHSTRTNKQESVGSASRVPTAPDQPLDDSVSDAEQTAPAKRLYGDCFVGVSSACAMDPKVPMLAKRISVAAKYLAGRDIDPACIERFKNWWAANDWRGQRGDLPTPERIVELWLQFEARKTAPAARVAASQAPRPASGRAFRRPLASFTPEERAAAEAKARREIEEEGEA